MKKQQKTALAVAVAAAAWAGLALAAHGVPGQGNPRDPSAETVGNNLSFPVIWSDGVTKALRGTYGAPEYFIGLCEPLNPGAPCLTIDSVDWFFQQEEENTWQAEWLNATTGTSNNIANTTGAISPLVVDEVDWGDNLESRNWSVNSIVRVETTLYQDVTATPMTAFNMLYLFGEGPDEMQGSNLATYASNEATVYSGCARLTIQKLTKDRDDPTLLLTWDPSEGEWVGDVEAAAFNSGVWGTVEGPESPSTYSAEINVGGKVVYGYNWRPRRLDAQPAGDWRLTFSLDDNFGSIGHCNVALNTLFDPTTQVRLPEPEAVPEVEPVGGGTAVVDPANNLTYIDVRIESAKGGGRK